MYDHVDIPKGLPSERIKRSAVPKWYVLIDKEAKPQP